MDTHYLCHVRLIFILLFVACFFLSEASPYELFEQNGKMGIKDERGQVVIPPSFEALGWSDGSFSVIGETTGYRVQNHWGLINLKKEFITPAEFEELVYQGGEFVVARKQLNPASTKSGCINLRGKIILPFVYDGIKVNGLRAIVFNLVGSRFSYGLTNMKNEVLIPLLYKDIHSLGTLRYAVENREGKIALFSENGSAVSDFTIDSLSAFYKGFSIIHEHGLQGLIDREGVVKAPARYQSIKIEEDGRVLGKLPGEWIYLDSQNKALTRILADDLLPVRNRRTIIKSGDKFGLIDDLHQPLLPTEWDSLRELEDDLFLVKKTDRWGAIRSTSELQVPVVYNTLQFDEGGYRAFLKTSGWLLLDKKGIVKTAKAYRSIQEFDFSTWKVRNGIYWGLLNQEGNEVVHCVFDSIGDRIGNLVAVKFKGLYGIIDLQENWIIAPQRYPIRLADETRYLLIQPGNSFLKSMDGKVIYFTSYPVEFKEKYWVEHLPNGTENKLSYDGLKIMIEEKPQIKTSATQLSVPGLFQMNEGLQGVCRNGKYGFVDAKGKLRIANRYDSIGAFQDGLAPVKLIGMWGFINSADKIVIQPNYESVSSFVNGLSIVQRSARMGLIDQRGQVVLPLRYEHIDRLSTGKFLLKANRLLGVAHVNGTIEIEPRFDDLKVLENGQLLVKQANKWGLISSSGLDIIPMQYDKLQFDPVKNQYLAFHKSEWRVLDIK
ncbi:MAG: WG repeat-containing protein [Cyclobacteriaceae bacterium]